jgi:hypothetical protein
MINVATPSEMPRKENKVIREKNLSLVFGNKYFVEIQSSKKEIIKIILPY